MQERRQNVRVRPAADYSLSVDLGSGLIKERLSILDVAVGGVAVAVSAQLEALAVGSELSVGITLPGVARFETVGTVRHKQGEVGGRCGIHFNHLTADQQTSLSRAVSELLERGYAV
jgi:hypothetical protein